MAKKFDYASGNSHDDTLNQPCTRGELKAAMQFIAQTIGKDINNLIKHVDDTLGQASNAHNELSNLTENLRLHVLYSLEKLGAFDADGKPTADFNNWVAGKVNEIEEMKKEAIAAGEWQEPQPAPELAKMN